MDNSLLTANRITPTEFGHIVDVSKHLIEDTLEAMYGVERKNGGAVQRGSVWLLHLANSMNKVISPAGLQRNSTVQSNRGIFSDPKELVMPFRAYADTLVLHGLLAEIRSNENKVAGFTGAFLLARDTPLL